jgi:hypothetical protein
MSRPTPSLSVTFTHIGLTFKAECDFYPLVRGRFSGPPEDCYPDEGGEAEITELECDGTDALFLLGSDLADDLSRAAYDACCGEMYRMAEDAAESRAADRAEDRRGW